MFDSGFVLGDGVWEGLRLNAGRIAFLDRHFDRLWDGAKMLRIDIGLSRAELAARLFDVIEANEAFAAQACAVAKDLEFDPAKVNPNGSGISLGHPVGATGAIVTLKGIYELHRTQTKYALATMCIGGGQGIASIWERT